MIDSGISGGGGNDMLVVSGSERVTNRLIVGSETITSGAHSDAVLFADGKIAAKACIVTINNWADDVFNDSYPLPSLVEVEEYVKANSHLPNVPTECEVTENGISIGDISTTLLRKIEELTLYAIQQQKEIEILKRLLTK